MKLENSLCVRSRHPSIALPVLLVCGLCMLSSCGKTESPAGSSTGGSKTSATASPAGGGSAAPDTSDKPLDHPAKLAEVAGFLDLSTFPMMSGAEPARLRTLANLAYAAAGNVKTAFEFQQKNLIAQRWKELPGSTITDQYGSGTFSRAGFHVSVSVGTAGAPGKVDVTVHNHGNVDLAKLPVPAAAKSSYAGPISAMFLTDAPIAATVEACRAPLLAAGWQPYGNAGDTSYYKQNAILITVMVIESPKQDGKTMINYMSALISADLPAPKDAEQLQYNDTQPQLRFQSAAGMDAIADFYRQALAPGGWVATKDKTVKVDDKDLLIFREPGKAMITLEMKPGAGGKTDASLLYQSTAEIAELERVAASQKAAAIKMLKEKADKPEPKIAITLPADAAGVQQTKNEMKFTVGNGKAKAAVEALRKQYLDAGWKEDLASLDPMAGTVALTKEDQRLSVTYTDTGFLPVEITVSSTGAELERSGAGAK